MYRWDRVSLEYRSLVSTTHDGNVALGFDWAASNVKQNRYVGAIKRESVLALTPNYDGPVWQRSPLIHLPPSKLRQRPWYDLGATDLSDKTPGHLVVVNGDEKAAGEVWVHYTVTLCGTHAA